VTHRIIAFLLLGHLIGIVIGVRKRGETRAIRRAAQMALSFVILQSLSPPRWSRCIYLRASLPSPGSWNRALDLRGDPCRARGRNAGMTEIEQIVYESPSRASSQRPKE